ncbi:MAG TPA: hypothetical protein VFU13_23705 [Steroidobacteraceae bacterium]|nr:hypothetical protein [Steroidobacteraceae bacterium]
MKLRVLLLCILSPLAAAAPPQNFLFADSHDLEQVASLIRRPDIGGVQVVYSWKSLETARDQYDFSRIERDLAYLESLNRKLFVQVQDRFFEVQHRNVPAYLLDEPVYGGGLAAQSDNPGENLPEGHGWVAQQWNPAVRERFQKLLSALAARFDGRVWGVNLPESSADIDTKNDRTGFTCDRYFAATLENIAFARKVFSKSHVVQYTNFWPCEWDNDRKYMSRAFEFAKQNRIGLGGPDIVPYKKGQMKNSYPFFNRYKGQLSLVAMAVQEPTLTYTNPQTGKRFTREEFVAFAENYLGVDVIFWSIASPWLRN